MHYVQRIEQGTRGCNPWVAQKLTEALAVDLEALRDDFAPKEEATGKKDAGVRGSRGASPPKAAPRRSLHLAYLEVLLEREVGSAFTVLDEKEFENRCSRLPVEELMEVVAARRRERGLVEELLADAERLHPSIRAFLESLMREQPDEDLRILASRRKRVHSEEERERLTLAMRRLLL